MKIIFMGTPEFAKEVLEKLIKEKYDIIAVVTQPDKIAGRKKVIEYSPVKKVALENNIRVLQPIKIKDIVKDLISMDADLIITAAYGQILPKELLDNLKAINVHGSILPKLRGGAPIQYALFEGLKETGVTIMDMAYKMDSGDIILSEKISIDEDDNYETLTNKLKTLGADLLIKVLKGKYERIKQDESLVSFAYTLKREDEFLNFYGDKFDPLNQLRGLLPNIGGTIVINNESYKVYKLKKSDIIKELKLGQILLTKKEMYVNSATGTYQILEIQSVGKKKMAVRDFLNGQKNIKNNDFIERRGI